ncbi:MAG: methyltransferase domain-containing protein [Deltaproteobacteria bacterium]|nr:methyltransferase domain-containing protein [Deltaproteobacteria bacterium]
MDQEKKYTWNADDYSKYSTAQQKWARELISNLDLNGSESILDIGCGDGKVTAEIATILTSGKVIGVDNSANMIELALQSFPGQNYPNLSFEISDASSLPFSEIFDVIFSNAALHWIKDHKPVLNSIYKALKSGGKILLQMGGKGNAKDIIDILDILIPEKKWNKYFIDFEFPYGFHDSQKYEIWLREVGFSDVRCELIPKIMSYDNRDGLAGWIRTTWLPYTDRLPFELREEFINCTVDKYIEKNGLKSNGSVNVDMIRLEAEAIKN